MKTLRELLRSPVYWIETIQNAIFNMVLTHMETEQLNQSKLADKLGVTKGYISQILNGNFNFSIQKLIELSLKLGMVPVLHFENLDKYIENEMQRRYELPGAKIIPMNPEDRSFGENVNNLRLCESELRSDIEEVIDTMEPINRSGLLEFQRYG